MVEREREREIEKIRVSGIKYNFFNPVESTLRV
jgi:hypothetical protein